VTSGSVAEGISLTFTRWLLSRDVGIQNLTVALFNRQRFAMPFTARETFLAPPPFERGTLENGTGAAEQKMKKRLSTDILYQRTLIPFLDSR